MNKNEEIIYAYTDLEAVKDGILFPVAKINKNWEKGPFKYITRNLLEKEGYLPEGDLTVEESQNFKLNIRDLLIQVSNHLQGKKMDSFYQLKIEGPKGNQFRIFVCQNETGYTIMLPEDY